MRSLVHLSSPIPTAGCRSAQGTARRVLVGFVRIHQEHLASGMSTDVTNRKLVDVGKYQWRTQHREGTSEKKPNYSVKWEWRDPELSGNYRRMVDLVNATNAERAINKVRKAIQDTYGGGRSDVVIIHVVPIDGPYYEL